MAKKKTVKDIESVEKSKVKNVKTIKEEVEIEEDELELEESTSKKVDKKTVKSSKKENKKEKKEGFLQSVRKELRKVVWPKGGEIFKYTIAVIVLCLVLALFFAGMELLAAFVKGLFV